MGFLSLHRYNLIIIRIPIISLAIVSLYKEYLFIPNPSRPVRDTYSTRTLLSLRISRKTRVELTVALVHT